MGCGLTQGMGESHSYRLVERHRLPWRVFPNLQFYILTLGQSCLAGISLVSALASAEDVAPLPYPGFVITVPRLDEFVTKEDWEQYVVPRQHRLWEERGKRPQGRRAWSG
jgi:hypothetical protein